MRLASTDQNVTTGTTVLALGTFEIQVEGRTIERWGGGRARELLQYLLLRPGQVVLRSMLEAALWPRAVAGRSSSVKVAVHALRRALQEARGEAGGSREEGDLELITQGPGYLLRTRRLTMDLKIFQDRIAQAQDADAAGREQEAHRMYGSAVEVYTGDLLPGVDSEWADLPRQFHRSQVLGALDRLAELELRRGEQSEVLRWCQRSIEIDAVHEQTYRNLMTLYGRLGQPRMVRHWFRRCVAALREDLDVMPEPATVSTYRQMQSTQVLAPATGDRAGTWRVLVNDCHEFALVPTRSSVPAGWLEAGITGSPQECARWIEGA